MVFFAVWLSLSSSALTLKDYRYEVEKVDPRFQSRKALQFHAHEVEGAYSLATDWHVFAGANFLDDKRPTTNPSFQGDRTRAWNYRLGVEKQFLFGPSIKISENWTQVDIENASPAAIPLPEYWDAYPEIEFTFPLWRNWLGRQVRAEDEKKKNQFQLKALEADMKWIRGRAEVDLAYYGLLAQVERLEATEDILARAHRIFSWVKGQRRRSLNDPSDVYQAEAAVDLRKMELIQIQAELDQHKRRFNSFRGQAEETPIPRLKAAPLDPESLRFKFPENRVSKSMAALEQSARLERAEAQAMAEQYKPQFKILGRHSWTGRDEGLSGARGEVFEEDQTYWYLGFEFSMPLDQFRYYGYRKHYDGIERSQEKAVLGTQKDQVLDWLQFVSLGETLAEQIEILRRLEQTQKRKADSERKKWERGRSTTFQVLTFEQDYISTKIQRVMTELKGREFLTQAPLYSIEVKE